LREVGSIVEQDRRSRGRARDRTKPLPPLDYLLAFEAAAEQMSFAGASKVLNLSETAISRKVRLLELYFGLTFFERGHRSITLTQFGREFLTRIQPALDMLRTAADDMQKTGQNRPVVLAATNSVAALWLTPRLRKFREANRHLNIMLVASDDDEECLAETVDLTILRGDGDWPGYDAQLVFGETIFPVCSPDFLAANPDICDAEALPDAQLIEVSSSHTEWMNWRTWLTQIGVPTRRLERTMLFNTYPPSIHAAVDGVGVALGWGHLVDQLLEAGKLVRPLGGRHVRTEHGYYLLTPRNRPAFPGRQEVAEWLMNVSAGRTRYLDAKPQIRTE
jgi:DNA-binding transcriptional LysR family regulator